MSFRARVSAATSSVSRGPISSVQATIRVRGVSLRDTIHVGEVETRVVKDAFRDSELHREEASKTTVVPDVAELLWAKEAPEVTVADRRCRRVCGHSSVGPDNGVVVTEI
jgi:hypothetical protein